MKKGLFLIPAFTLIAAFISYSATAEEAAWQIQPQFDDAGSFSDGLARVRVNGKGYGFVDRDGNIVIKPQFDSAEDFCEGLARIRKDLKYGFIDKTGAVVIEPVYDEAFDFSEGLAAVRKGDYTTGRWGFIDREGKTAIGFTFENVRSFSEGRAAFEQSGKGKGFFDRAWGFIDREGKTVADSIYFEVGDFSNGLAAAKMKTLFGNGTAWGYLDRSGKVAIRAKYYNAGTFSEGLAPCMEESLLGMGGYTHSYIDAQGKTAVSVPYALSPFSEGLAAMTTKNKYGGQVQGYVSRTGEFAFEPKYEYQYIGNFSEGLALVHMKDRTSGFIDRTGKTVIAFSAGTKKEFSEGLAAFYSGAKWGYVRNPLITVTQSPKQETTLVETGMFIGEVKSVMPREIIVGGSAVGDKVFLGDRLTLFAGDSMILLRSTFPMQTVTKCELVSGKKSDIKPGMKVYKYRKIRETAEEKNQKK